MGLILLKLLFLLMLIEQTYQRTCVQVSSRGLNIRPGEIIARVSVGYIKRYKDSIACMKECMLKRKCSGVNFHTDLQFCELLYSIVRIDDTRRLTISYMTISDVHVLKKLVGTCATRPCGMNEKCVPTTLIHTCIAWCDNPNSLHNFVIENVDNGAPGHYVTELHCFESYLPITRDRRATCLEDGTWLFAEGWGCTEIRNCSMAKMCHRRYAHDGDYRVFAASGNGRVTVRCSNMTSDTPETSAGQNSGPIYSLSCWD